NSPSSTRTDSVAVPCNAQPASNTEFLTPPARVLEIVATGDLDVQIAGQFLRLSALQLADGDLTVDGGLATGQGQHCSGQRRDPHSPHRALLLFEAVTF